jgi:hypothetical protein
MRDAVFEHDDRGSVRRSFQDRNDNGMNELKRCVIRRTLIALDPGLSSVTAGQCGNTDCPYQAAATGMFP